MPAPKDSDQGFGPTGTTTRCGFVAVLGEANAGKSTLVNALTGEKVSIVSAKAHTTRQGIYGIVCDGPTQMILVDTPGLIPQPRGPLQSFMAKATSRSMREADIAVVVIDATRSIPESTRILLDKMKEKSLLIALNKVDKVHKDDLLPLAESVSAWSEHIFMISALRAQGIQDLGQAIVNGLPEGPWLFDAADITQISSRVWAAEIVREKIFNAVHHEVP
jgi:GTPase